MNIRINLKCKHCQTMHSSLEDAYLCCHPAWHKGSDCLYLRAPIDQFSGTDHHIMWTGVHTSQRPSRLLWELQYGHPIPHGLKPTCGFPNCINPAHQNVRPDWTALPVLRPRNGMYHYPWRHMEVGSGFSVRKRSHQVLRAAAYDWARRNNPDWKFSLRTLTDGRIGIWRVS